MTAQWKLNKILVFKTGFQVYNSNDMWLELFSQNEASLILVRIENCFQLSVGKLKPWVKESKLVQIHVCKLNKVAVKLKKEAINANNDYIFWDKYIWLQAGCFLEIGFSCLWGYLMSEKQMSIFSLLPKILCKYLIFLEHRWCVDKHTIISTHI